MTTRNITLLSLAVLMLGTVAAYAQQVHAVRATIPFEFTVGKDTYPAGEYTVTLSPFQNRELILLSGPEGKALRFMNTLPCEPCEKTEEAYLMFRGYGKQQFLAQIWTGSSAIGRALLMSKAEREIAKTAGNNGPRRLLLAAN